jgi:hypothetical protein
MSFRDDVRRAFDDSTSPAPPGFDHRVLSSARRPVEREQGTHWGLALVATLLAVALIGGLLFTRLIGNGTSPAGRNTTPTPGIVTSPTPTAAPSPSAIPSPTPTVCSVTVPQQPGVAMPSVITAVRVGSDGTRDRFVIEFNGPVPPITLTKQSGTVFTQDASGRQITVQGTTGWKLVLHGADEHASYTGPSDFVTGYPQLKEARNIGDFEGVVTWALGVNSANACPAVSVITGPNRLVIDFPDAG